MKNVFLHTLVCGAMVAAAPSLGWADKIKTNEDNEVATHAVYATNNEVALVHAAAISET